MFASTRSLGMYPLRVLDNDAVIAWIKVASSWVNSRITCICWSNSSPEPTDYDDDDVLEFMMIKILNSREMKESVGFGGEKMNVEEFNI